MPPVKGILNRNIDDNAQIATSKLAAGRDFFTARSPTNPDGVRTIGALKGARWHGGVKARNTLRLAANIAEAETVTIGPMNIDGVLVTDIYEYDVINTDSLINTASGQWNTTSVLPRSVTMAAHGRAAGDLLRVENEIFKILRVLDVNTVVVAPGRCGTAIATHADALDIFWSATPPAANIPVGVVTTLTPAVAGPALVAEINNALVGTAGLAGERATAKAGRVYRKVKATSFQAGAEILLEARNVGAFVPATTETLAGANNAWNAAAMFGGSEPATKQSIGIVYVPTAQDVTLGFIRIPVPFTPTFVQVVVRTTATGVVVAWVGGVVPSAGYITIDNVGATDWAATDTLYIEASE